MNISDITIRLFVLLIPGLICTVLIDYFTVHKKWSNFYFILYSILLGFISYLFYQILLYLFSLVKYFICGSFQLLRANFWSSLFDSKIPISSNEILFTSIVAIILGFLISVTIQKKWILKLAKYLHITNKYGDEDLYMFFLNAEEVDWVWVRDDKKGFTYEGLVDSYAETATNRELTLSDVRVYNSENSKLLYSIPGIYLSYPINENLIIELPINKYSEENNEKTKNSVD